MLGYVAVSVQRSARRAATRYGPFRLDILFGPISPIRQERTLCAAYAVPGAADGLIWTVEYAVMSSGSVRRDTGSPCITFIALKTRYAYHRCTKGIVTSNMLRGRHYRFEDVNQKQNFSLHYKSASLKRITTY